MTKKKTYVVFNYLIQVYIDTKTTDESIANSKTKGLDKLELSESTWDYSDADWVNKYRK